MHVLLIQNGVVVNSICADSVARAQQFYPNLVCVEQPADGQAAMGWTTTDNVNFTPPVKPVLTWMITKFALLNRLLPAEVVAINLARQGTGATAAQMESLWQYLSTASFIDLQASTTAALIQELVTAGVLTLARATTILTTPPTSAEVLGGV